MTLKDYKDQLIFNELSLHQSFYLVQEKLKKWTTKFSHVDDPSIFSDLLILYLIAPKKFLDFRAHMQYDFYSGVANFEGRKGQ